LIALLRKLLADERMRRFEPTAEQLAMIESIGETLEVEPAPRRGRASPRKTTRKSAATPHQRS
jgi:hypothetical protein